MMIMNALHQLICPFTLYKKTANIDTTGTVQRLYIRLYMDFTWTLHRHYMDIQDEHRALQLRYKGLQYITGTSQAYMDYLINDNFSILRMAIHTMTPRFDTINKKKEK